MRRFIGLVLAAVVAVCALATQDWAQVSSGTVNARLQDGSGNRLASSTAAPVGSEQALIVRNIPSGTQTVNGTVTANAGTGTFNVSAVQSGTWTVQPGNTQNTTAWLVTQPGLTSVVTGQQAVTTTATALPSNAGKRVCIKILIAGTQTVYFGPSTVTTSNGQELSPGDAWCGNLDNSNRIYVIAGATGSTVAFDVNN